MFPLMTLSGGTIVWAIVIRHGDALYSPSGDGTTLVVFAVPVAFWVMRLNRP